MLSDVWVYNGRAYDLSEWIAKHPGGAFFIGRTKNRDITAIIGPTTGSGEGGADAGAVSRWTATQRRGTSTRSTTRRRSSSRKSFNSWRDTPKYRFDNPDDLMHRVKARLAEPALAARIKRMDGFSTSWSCMLAIGLFRGPGRAAGRAPVDAVAGVRDCDGAAAQFACRATATTPCTARSGGSTGCSVNAFDMNYVALSLVVADGHALLHHPYTQSEVDIKKNVFTMMMRLPRLYRVPVHTLHKFGHTVTGMADANCGRLN